MSRARWSPDRDTNALCLEAETAGWAVDFTGSDHIRLRAPNGALAFASKTPSDWRTIHNLRAEMRRLWPGWDGRVEKGEPRVREKRPGRKACEKVPRTWDGTAGVAEPMRATLGDVWPVQGRVG